jgi:hypothetical protein
MTGHFDWENQHPDECDVQKRGKERAPVDFYILTGAQLMKTLIGTMIGVKNDGVREGLGPTFQTSYYLLCVLSKTPLR